MKEYFEQKLEPRKNVFKKIPENLLVNLSDSSMQEGGELDFEKNNLHFNIKYSIYEDPDPYVQWEIKQGMEKAGYWKKLDSLTINDSNNSLDLKKYLEKYAVFFSEDETGIHHIISAKDKKIEMGPILTPRAILQLMHEIGHFEYRKNLEKNDPKKLNDLIIASTSLLNDKKNTMRDWMNKDELKKRCELKLEEERSAWAFALKKLKPFIKKDGLFSKKDVLNYVHDVCLQTYYRSFGAKLNSSVGELVDTILSNIAYKKAVKMLK